MPGTTDLALAIDGVTKRYGDHLAVDALSFTVPRGAVYGVLGPNGAGKTTTLRMINDIIAPDAGHIRLFGALPPGPAAAARIGYLPEERGLYPKVKVAEMIAFMGELRGLPRREAALRAGRWLERLGLAGWAGHRVQELSKGMQQKVQFACALVHEPELVILDEPWSGLDPINAQVLEDVVAELHRAGRTILFSTHQMEQAERLCDAVCIIARGRAVAAGPLEALKAEALAARPERRVALSVTRPERLDPILADRALIARSDPQSAPPDHGLVVELAAAVEPGALLAALVAAEVGLTRFEVLSPTLRELFVERVRAAEARP